MVAVTPEIVAVLVVTLVVLVLFAIEPVRLDVIAIGIMVTLMLFEPATKPLAAVGLLSEPLSLLEKPIDGVSGFSNTATMFILSEGIRRTGFIEILTERGSRIGDGERRQLGGIMGVVTPISGFIGNTAAVAILFRW